MHWLVRLARGRTAEIIGEEGLPADRLARTLDLGGVADSEVKSLPRRTRRVLEAYTRGVNARVARIRSGAVAAPLSMQRAGVPLEDWTPADTLAVLKFYAWSLSASLDASLVLDDLLGRLGGVGARRFFPGPGGPDGFAEPPDPPVTARVWRDPLRRAAGLEGRSVGSSAWVLGGAYTDSGLPLLVADTHLAPRVPALLHLAHLRAGALDVAGAALPGVPVFWTGHNRRVAWASTHAPRGGDRPVRRAHPSHRKPLPRRRALAAAGGTGRDHRRERRRARGAAGAQHAPRPAAGRSGAGAPRPARHRLGGPRGSRSRHRVGP